MKNAYLPQPVEVNKNDLLSLIDLVEGELEDAPDSFYLVRDEVKYYLEKLKKQANV